MIVCYYALLLGKDLSIWIYGLWTIWPVLLDNDKEILKNLVNLSIVDRYSNSFGKWKLRTWVLIFNAEKSKRQEKTSAVIKKCINQFCLNQCTSMRTHVTQFIVTPANQAKAIFVVLSSSQSKCEANRSRGSWVMIGHPNKQTKITT